MSGARLINCECGNSYQIEESQSAHQCSKCGQAKMVFKRYSSENLTKSWQNILGCSEQEASDTIVHMLAEIAEQIQDKDS